MRMAGIIGAGGLLLLLYVCLNAYWPVNSDQVNCLYIAQDFTRGNWRLQGWTIAPDNYWGLEDLLTAAVWAATGKAMLTLRLVPALAFLALGGVAVALSQPARPGWWWRAAPVLGAALLVPTHIQNAADFFSEAPLHFLTVASILAAMGLAARFLEDGRRAGTLVLLAAISVDAAASDPMFVVLGSLPMVAALALAALPDRAPRWRLAAGILAAAALGRGLVALNMATGGFAAAPTPMVFADFDGLGRSFGITMRAVIGVLGCDPFGLPVRQAWVQLLRLPLLAVLGVPFYRLGQRVLARERPPFLETSLWLMAAGTVGVMLVTSKVHDMPSIRFILPAWAAVAVLAARWAWRGWRVPAYATMLLVVALGADARAVARPAPPAFTRVNQDLADCLDGLGLHEGYGTYWRASAVTLASGGQVTSRAVSVDRATRGAAPMMWMNDIGWYRPFPVQTPFFVISEPGDGRLPRSAVLARFGAPGASFMVDGAVVDVYGEKVPACEAGNAPVVAVTADMPGN